MKVTSKFDRQGGERLTDRYWGDVPKFLKYIPEAHICFVNPDFLQLMQIYVDGTLIKENVDPALYAEVENIMLNIGCPCLLDGMERAIMNAFLGNEPCPRPSHKLNCTDKICCNSIVSCQSESLCTGP